MAWGFEGISSEPRTQKLKLANLNSEPHTLKHDATILRLSRLSYASCEWGNNFKTGHRGRPFVVRQTRAANPLNTDRHMAELEANKVFHE